MNIFLQYLLKHLGLQILLIIWIQEGYLQLSTREKKKVIKTKPPYSWIDGELYKTGPDLIIRRRVREDEVLETLKACHDGPCGGKFSFNYKILLLGYYQPSIFKEAKEYVKRFDSCQRIVKHVPSNEMPLQPQVLIEPFEKWALDFVGPINPPSRQRTYIIFCIDYVRKWLESK